MKTIQLAILCIALFASNTFAQKSKDATLLTIGDQEIPVSDFKYLYEKNYGNADTAYNEASVREYLDLYIKFKLKVAEAYDRKMDESKKFKAEFEKYRKQLAKPYMSDRNITDGLIQEAYDRYKKEVKASHILVQVKNWGNPEDTAKAYAKTMKIRERVLNGEDFGKVAMETSDDPSAKINQGDLGYFTSMQMVFEFEDVAYKSPVGKLSMPVKTQFGYHLIKVTDKIEARGSRKVAHIMVRYTQGMTPEDSVQAIRKVSEIFEKLKSGGNWDDLARQFSDDGGSKANGGKLPWFSTGRMVPEFSEASFNLQELGEISTPIRSPFGWHIIRLDSVKGIPEFEELRPTIKQRVSRDSRAQLSKKLFLNQLKEKNNLQEYTKLHEEMFSKFDSSLVAGAWKYNADDKLASKILLKLNKDKVPVKRFFDYVVSRQRKLKEGNAMDIAKELYQQYVDETVLKYEEDHLAARYPEYKNLLREYREGILLFDIMDGEVWGKSVADTSGLRTYFEGNREDYQWKTRARTTVFSLGDASMLPKLKAELEQDTFVVEDLSLTSLIFLNNDTLVDRPKRRVIDRVVLAMKQNTDYIVRIEGYGVEGESKEVVDKRLNEIMKYFVEGFRIKPGRIILENKGQLEGKLNAPSKAGGKVSFTMLSTSPKVLEKKYNKEDALALQVTETWFEEGEKSPISEMEWKPGTYTFDQNGRTTYVIIHEVEAPRQKELNETKGLVISDYQNFLEEQWVAQLKAKFPVKIDEKLLNKLIKK